MNAIELYENDERIILIASTSGFSTPEIIRAIKSFATAAESTAKAISECWAILKSNAQEIHELLNQMDFEEMDREWKRDLHKLDFTRPRIHHQVTCRKPRNLNKKIIR